SATAEPGLCRAFYATPALLDMRVLTIAIVSPIETGLALSVFAWGLFYSYAPLTFALSQSNRSSIPSLRLRYCDVPPAWDLPLSLQRPSVLLHAKSECQAYACRCEDHAPSDQAATREGMGQRRVCCAAQLERIRVVPA